MHIGMLIVHHSIQVSTRKMDDTPCGCSRKCFDVVSIQQRQQLFDGFWKISHFDVQNAYLCGCVKVVDVHRRYTQSASSRRNYSRQYFVSNGSVSIQICKIAFLRIHAISNGRLSRALQAMQKEGGTPHSDQRGRHEPSNKTSEASIRVVKEHIEMFPRYRSHYSRKANPHREYLSPDLSLTKLYSLYQNFCKENNHATVSEWVYRKVFTDQYNLFFGK